MTRQVDIGQDQSCRSGLIKSCYSFKKMYAHKENGLISLW